jgi:hypothetical protein
MNDPAIPNGYIIVARKIIESEIWDKPPLYLKVWMYLLLSAQHSDFKKLKRGQVRTSIPEIREACSWHVGYRKVVPTKDQIYQVIDWLRKRSESNDETDTKATMIATTKATQGMVITIENYCFYQTSKNYESNDESNNETDTKATREQRTPNNINKNVKNVNNDKNENKKNKGEAEASSILSQSIQDIWNHYLKTFEGVFTRRPTLTENRKKAIRTRLGDKHPEKKGELLFSVDDIKLAISNIRQSPFHCGDNDTGKIHADITFICRNAGKVEEWMNYQPKPQQQKVIPLKAGANYDNKHSRHSNQAPAAKPITKGRTGWINRPKKYRV